MPSIDQSKQQQAERRYRELVREIASDGRASVVRGAELRSVLRVLDMTIREAEDAIKRERQKILVVG